MAIRYLRSTTGADANDGLTWATAKATLVGALNGLAAGDTVYVSQAHAETSSSSLTFTYPEAPTNPVRVICVSDSAEPPTALANTATITTTGSAGMTFAGTPILVGVSLNMGTSFSGGTFVLNNTAGDTALYRDLTLSFLVQGYPNVYPFNVNFTNFKTVFENVSLSFNTNGQQLFLGNGHFQWRGGKVTGTANTYGVLGASNGAASMALLSGLDLSGMATACSIFIAAGTERSVYKISNSRLPAGWTGNLITGTVNPGTRAEMHNCDSGDTNYRLAVADYCGKIVSETGLVKTGGATDGTTPFSFKLTSNTKSAYPASILATPELPAIWNTTVGTPITVSVDILCDQATALNDNDVWLDVQYLGTTGYPISSTISTVKSLLATAAALPASSATWTTTGMTNPQKCKLSVTFTPQKVGFIQAVVNQAKPSFTLYVDPLLQVS